jgi:uncharacterized protein (DUF1778 family)
MAIIDKPEAQMDDLPEEENEFPKPLSERDSIRLIEMLENPPEPSDALKKAVARYRAMAVRR